MGIFPERKISIMTNELSRGKSFGHPKLRFKANTNADLKMLQNSVLLRGA